MTDNRPHQHAKVLIAVSHRLSLRSRHVKAATRKPMVYEPAGALDDFSTIETKSPQRLNGRGLSPVISRAERFRVT